MRHPGQALPMSQLQTPCGEIYSALAADPDLAELVEMFVDEMPQRIATLVEHYDSGNWDALGRTAHQLKGAVGSYGFHELTPYAAALEQAVRGGGSQDEIQQCLEQLIQHCRMVKAGVR